MFFHLLTHVIRSRVFQSSCYLYAKTGISAKIGIISTKWHYKSGLADFRLKPRRKLRAISYIVLKGEYYC